MVKNKKHNLQDKYKGEINSNHNLGSGRILARKVFEARPGGQMGRGRSRKAWIAKKSEVG